MPVYPTARSAPLAAAWTHPITPNIFIIQNLLLSLYLFFFLLFYLVNFFIFFILNILTHVPITDPSQWLGFICICVLSEFTQVTHHTIFPYYEKKKKTF